MNKIPTFLFATFVIAAASDSNTQTAATKNASRKEVPVPFSLQASSASFGAVTSY
jgi:hypothetical protein